MNKKDQAALEELQAYLASRDEKTNTQSDKKLLGIQKRSANSHWHENMKDAAQARANNPDWREKTLARNRNAPNNPDWKRKHAEGVARREADPEYKRKLHQGFANRVLKDESRQSIKKASQERFNDPEWRKKHQAKIDQRTNDPVWKAKQHEARLARTLAVMTPSGPFSTQRDAIKWATEHGVKNASKKLKHWLETGEPGFYFISRDEYNSLNKS